ncbi:MAG: nickel pincer cofactor biosynthesis protein LarB [Lentisphaerae bacterium]|nr:nickel pincer cofactor biosynthesis protein LarB [Lentisphaerota bacterium]
MAVIEEILRKLQAGSLDLAGAFALALAENDASEMPVTQERSDLVVARLDRNRGARCGFPEFIYGAGKTVEELLKIIPQLHASKVNVLATRVKAAAGAVLQEHFPQGSYDERSGCFLWMQPDAELRGKAVILSAGTSDLPAALEAQMTLQACNCSTELIVDAGVAALHRLLKVLDKLQSADVVIAAAGMEGALPSVVAGLIKVPVIALPTSVGYGANLQGLTPMLAMLNSCASGVTVVNIDNGFGAACAAARIINAKY